MPKASSSKKRGRPKAKKVEDAVEKKVKKLKKVQKDTDNNPVKSVVLSEFNIEEVLDGTANAAALALAYRQLQQLTILSTMTVDIANSLKMIGVGLTAAIVPKQMYDDELAKRDATIKQWADAYSQLEVQSKQLSQRVQELETWVNSRSSTIS